MAQSNSSPPAPISSVLHGRRILLTRTPRQNQKLAAALAELGAVTIELPLLEIAPPASYDALDQVIDEWREYDLAIFTSANGVHAFFDRVLSQGQRLRIPDWLCAMGPATEHALADYGWRASLIPEKFVAESAAALLGPLAPERRVVIVQAAEARGILENALTQAGGRVTAVAAYQTRMPAEAPARMRELFAPLSPDEPARKVDAILLTSALAVTHLAQALGLDYLQQLAGIALGAIGPITQRKIIESGLTPAFTAPVYTASGLIAGLQAYFQQNT